MSDDLNTEENENVVNKFRKVDPKILSEVLEAESIHTCALVMASLESSKATQVLQSMPKDKQTDIIEDIVRGERIPTELYELTLRGILEKVHEIEIKKYVALGGIDCAVEILNQLELGSEKAIIANLEKRDKNLSEKIKKRIFVFDDIVMLSDRDIQKLLRETDMYCLAKALKNADAEVQEKIFRNMSQNAATMLKEDMEYMGQILLKDVEESQQKIISTIRRLEDCGEIVIPRLPDTFIE